MNARFAKRRAPSDKPADIQIIGDALSIDKVMLDALIEPVMHLLRNAVDNGLEAPDRRSLTAKPAQGLITLKFSQVAQMLKIEVSENGGGMDYPRIAQRARALGVLLSVLAAAIDSASEMLEVEAAHRLVD